MPFMGSQPRGSPGFSIRGSTWLPATFRFRPGLFTVFMHPMPWNTARSGFRSSRTGRSYATCNTCRDRHAVRVIAGAGRNTRTRNVAGSQVEPRMLNPGEPLGWLPINGMESVEPHGLGRMDTVCTFCDAKHWLSERLAVSSCSL